MDGDRMSVKARKSEDWRDSTWPLSLTVLWCILCMFKVTLSAPYSRLVILIICPFILLDQRIDPWVYRSGAARTTPYPPRTCTSQIRITKQMQRRVKMKKEYVIYHVRWWYNIGMARNFFNQKEKKKNNNKKIDQQKRNKVVSRWQGENINKLNRR